MIVNPLSIEVYDLNDKMYLPPARNVQFSKAMEGGEDLWLSFVLDREPNVDYIDLGYSHDVIARRGFGALWAGEIREITQDVDEITVGCLGRYVHLTDANYGGSGKIWCESRYGRWKVMTNSKDAMYWPEKYQQDNAGRLFMAPRKNENFVVSDDRAGWYYYAAVDGIYRISFDIEALLQDDWQLILASLAGTPDAVGGVIANELIINDPGQQSTFDIILQGTSGFLLFFMQYTPVAPADYTGETGDVRVVVTNLRLWRHVETESPSIIHTTEKAIEQIEATTPISADAMLTQEQMFVRDYFVDPNGTNLANHQPNIDKERGGWTVALGTFDIQANQTNVTGVGGVNNQAIAVIDAGQSDGIISVDKFCDVSTDILGLVFRYQDANNFWLLYPVAMSPALWRLSYYQAGVLNVVTSAALLWLHTSDHNVMVYLRGDRIDCYIAGTWRMGTNNALFQTETEHGIIAWGAAAINGDFDNFEVFQALPLWPLYYEKGESGLEAMQDAVSYGDWTLKKLAWGVEPGGDRVFLRSPERDRVRYVIEPQYAQRLQAKGKTDKNFVTEAWAKYTDEEGVEYLTDKYYAHVTPDGIEATTVAAGNDLASTIYGTVRDTVLEFSRVDAALAITFLQQHLRENAHPEIRSSYQVFGPVEDRFKGGAMIDLSEMEMGYLCQIPHFRASEAVGAAAGDWRDWDTTFLLVGMEYDHESGLAKLIPEGASEDLRRMIKVARAIEVEEGKKLLDKRPWFPYM